MWFITNQFTYFGSNYFMEISVGVATKNSRLLKVSKIRTHCRSLRANWMGGFPRRKTRTLIWRKTPENLITKTYRITQSSIE